MTVCELSNRDCIPCTGATPPLDAQVCALHLAQLHSDWRLNIDSTRLTRRFGFKGFAKAVQLANLAAWFAEKEGHHPDISFGWGYCELCYTTHEISGLSENDFICAAKFDRLIA